ncbi:MULTISPECIES: aminotransferase class III-fold pyridoxal phosphate-dependent enzyme [unclassified Achromobacter]|uniref:aminotransferase class III-fold pyridoxal phosphate-dependent enzyme n=1 Tax=unclassified Achromobacter TaxID=2626865 RepID=UPI000B51DE91|nr:MULTISPECIES: aminotransferase class III-fold pyridoxal phosphate-dependent enzyme [unclassified Achromobacter]OWT80430.1 glutamate-1-semialdehyde 2,1-aminomutase [Achromobacter sp. HZ34]OWT82313.1 glutamate-1-semialdehyde 2,1-aminomutase [Achromobacter sp. HZ28]
MTALTQEVDPGSSRVVDEADRDLRQRAARVIPGGMYGHLNAKILPPGYPQFYARADGCRLWDVDGREYLDFMCSWGPIIVGHQHPAVEEAARRQGALGDCMNGPSARLVELSERLVGLLPHADWAVFQKNGTDATTTAVTVARAGTRKRKIVLAKGAYHGAVPWCSPSLAGVTAEDRAHLIYFRYNDVESLEAAVREAGDDLAAILVSAFRHDMGQPQELPTVAFARAARNLCDRKGAALIVDEVRAGLRLSMQGSWEALGVRPDLSAWSKAIANGYALAAVTGSDAWRPAAQEIYVTGSFWMGGVAMAAALATLDVLQSSDAVRHFEEVGQRLRDGLARQAARHGLAIRQTGPVQLPSVLFEDDTDYAKSSFFCAEAIKQGVYLHPRHNMFLSLAHSTQDIDLALQVTDHACARLAAHL